MSNFLYFLPETLAPIQWKKVPSAVQSVLSDPSIDSGRISGAGPTGLPGAILSAQRPKSGKQARVAYEPKEQTWRKVAAQNGSHVEYWVGYWNSERPKPDDLRRNRMTDGHDLELADGNHWQIPAVHANFNTLPESFSVTETGEVEIKTSAGYEEIQSEAEKWHEIYHEAIANDSLSIDKAEWFRFACKLLSINYQVGIHECSMLDLFHTSWDLIFSVLNCAADIPALSAERDAQNKKKDTPPDGTEVSPGVEDSTPAINQPAPT